jgi:hypothetical protein
MVYASGANKPNDRLNTGLVFVQCLNGYGHHLLFPHSKTGHKFVQISNVSGIWMSSFWIHIVYVYLSEFNKLWI